MQDISSLIDKKVHKGFFSDREKLMCFIAKKWKELSVSQFTYMCIGKPEYLIVNDIGYKLIVYVADAAAAFILKMHEQDILSSLTNGENHPNITLVMRIPSCENIRKHLI